MYLGNRFLFDHMNFMMSADYLMLYSYQYKYFHLVIKYFRHYPLPFLIYTSLRYDHFMFIKYKYYTRHDSTVSLQKLLKRLRKYSEVIVRKIRIICS